MFLPVVMAFVEQSSLALGLEKPEALKMTLASEELFLHLCRGVIPNRDDSEFDASVKGISFRVIFRFPRLASTCRPSI